MSELSRCPTCKVAECVGHDDGHCMMLTNNDFGQRKCPFFKTREQVAEEKVYFLNRMASIRKGV